VTPILFHILDSTRNRNFLKQFNNCITNLGRCALINLGQQADWLGCYVWCRSNHPRTCSGLQSKRSFVSINSQLSAEMRLFRLVAVLTFVAAQFSTDNRFVFP